jgi:hypothetical protein
LTVDSTIHATVEPLRLKYGIPPYVDASYRRESDFELESPFISGLCRPSFIAALAVGDVLVYVTKKSIVH